MCVLTLAAVAYQTAAAAAPAAVGSQLAAAAPSASAGPASGALHPAVGACQSADASAHAAAASGRYNPAPEPQGGSNNATSSAESSWKSKDICSHTLQGKERDSKASGERQKRRCTLL